jgi:hypothetical protein
MIRNRDSPNLLILYRRSETCPFFPFFPFPITLGVHGCRMVSPGVTSKTSIFCSLLNLLGEASARGDAGTIVIVGTGASGDASS